MGHMQKEITAKQSGWAVETRDAGTCYVPQEVVSIPDWLRFGVALTGKDSNIHEQEVFATLVALVADYVPGHHIESIEAIEGHYFARWSAPGYLDSTEWTAHKTIKEARESLSED